MAQLGGLLQGSAAARPKNIYSGSQGLAQGLPKDEFSLGTHQLGRVPTWSLYNIHVVADSCTHSLTKKRVFPGYPPTMQGTQMVPLYHPWGRTPVLGPSL